MLLQRVIPTLLDTGLSTWSQRGRGRAEVTKIQARALSVRSHGCAFPDDYPVSNSMSCHSLLFPPVLFSFTMRKIKYLFVYKHSAHWNVSFRTINLIVEIFQIDCLIFPTRTRYSFSEKCHRWLD